MTVNELVTKLASCNPHSEVFIQLSGRMSQYVSVLDAYPAADVLGAGPCTIIAASSYQLVQTPISITEVAPQPTETERDKLWQQFLDLQDVNYVVVIKPWFALSWSMYHDLEESNTIENAHIHLLPGSDAPHLLNVLLAYLLDSELDYLVEETVEYAAFCQRADDLHAYGEELEKKYSEFSYMDYLMDRWEEHYAKCLT